MDFEGVKYSLEYIRQRLSEPSTMNAFTLGVHFYVTSPDGLSVNLLLQLAALAYAAFIPEAKHTTERIDAIEKQIRDRLP